MSDLSAGGPARAASSITAVAGITFGVALPACFAADTPIVLRVVAAVLSAPALYLLLAPNIGAPYPGRRRIDARAELVESARRLAERLRNVEADFGVRDRVPDLRLSEQASKEDREAAWNYALSINGRGSELLAAVYVRDYQAPAQAILREAKRQGFKADDYDEMFFAHATNGHNVSAVAATLEQIATDWERDQINEWRPRP